MARENFNDLLAFVAVAREGSFTRAAAQIGISPSALSQTISGLEARLKIRLLARTTRKVSPTDAGVRLLATLAPRFEEIEAELAALSELRDKPAGTVRITASEHASNTVLMPTLAKFLPEYPDIKIEINSENRLVDIVEQRYDAGVRLGEQVAKDMVAVRIGPDVRMVVVGSPAYFAEHAPPRTPQDLTHHSCINLRLPTLGGLYAWEMKKGRRELNVRVDGQLVVNGVSQMLKASVAGLGLGFMLEDVVKDDVAKGRLIPALEDWSPTFSGYHLYYPSRRQPSPAFALLVEALRYRA
ncbi:LysR family transcriptional regulator [Janthinobacterium sp. 17J80-10]|uniref:LysR family transcriptional regulator n=1 Tax=Janthinobacterium sp. 17J80-10 TaxID=2497863 RepID=UPI00100568EE|nr:LysR family transcriptional regulator [Janthinobacterium sp. 17J80-10]QAU33889.1 LysR family transcriptional regulator [Janthinobacterium sp. 17J80-10]